jgi:hypothetical protein
MATGQKKKKRERIKRHSDWEGRKGRDKTVFIHR